MVAKITLYEANTLTPCTQMNKPWEMRCVSERDSEVRDLVSRKVRTTFFVFYRVCFVLLGLVLETPRKKGYK